MDGSLSAWGGLEGVRSDNGIIGTERLIRVAVARDPEQAMPIKGTFTGASDVLVKALVDVQVHALPTVEPHDAASETKSEPAAGRPEPSVKALGHNVPPSILARADE